MQPSTKLNRVRSLLGDTKANSIYSGFYAGILRFRFMAAMSKRGWSDTLTGRDIRVRLTRNQLVIGKLAFCFFLEPKGVR